MNRYQLLTCVSLLTLPAITLADGDRIIDVANVKNVGYFVDGCAGLVASYPSGSSSPDGSGAASPADHIVWSAKTSTEVAYHCFPKDVYFPTLDSFFRRNPIAIVNEVAIAASKKLSTFTPRAKGQFEKTADYDAAVQHDRDEFNKAHAGKQLDLQIYGQAWSTIMGDIRVMTTQDQYAPKYDADKEELTINIKSHEYGYILPFTIHLASADAQKLCGRPDEGCMMSELDPSIAIYIDGDNLAFKSLTLTPNGYAKMDGHLDLFASINLKDLPINFALKHAYGPGAASLWEKNNFKVKH